MILTTSIQACPYENGHLIVYDTWCTPQRVFFIYKKKYKKMPKPNRIKVKKILKGTLDSITSPSSLLKSQIMRGKVWLRCKGKTLLGIVNKLLKTKSWLTTHSNVLPFPPIIWIFTEGEGDGIESRVPFKIFPALSVHILWWNGKEKRLSENYWPVVIF